MNVLDFERDVAVPAGVPAPATTALFLLEAARAWLELGATFASYPWLRHAPRGDGHPVLILPGLYAGDSQMGVLHRFLRDLGYATEPWEQGLNLGRWEALDPLLERFDALHAEYGRPLSLVGWSMGGLYARELARVRPSAVRLLVQLATPFHDRAWTNPNWPLYELASGASAEAAPREGRSAPRPAVPVLSIWSRSDGHVDWRNCVERAPAADGDAPVENVEVMSSHLGLRHHPAVLETIARALAAAKTQ